MCEKLGWQNLLRSSTDWLSLIQMFSLITYQVIRLENYFKDTNCHHKVLSHWNITWEFHVFCGPMLIYVYCALLCLGHIMLFKCPTVQVSVEYSAIFYGNSINRDRWDNRRTTNLLIAVDRRSHHSVCSVHIWATAVAFQRSISRTAEEMTLPFNFPAESITEDSLILVFIVPGIQNDWMVIVRTLLIISLLIHCWLGVKQV